jgi:hypothetical protein
MKTFFKDNIFKIVGITPFIIIGVGTLIINLHLSQYFIADFNFFQTTSFLTGSSYVLFLILLVMLMLLWMNVKEVNQNSYKRIFSNAILKPVFISNLLFFFTSSTYYKITTYSFLNFHIPSNYILAFCITPIFLFVPFFMMWPLRNENNKRRLEWYIAFVFSIFVIPLSLFTSYILYQQEVKYEHISKFVFSISFIVLITLLTRKGIEKDLTKNLSSENKIETGFTSFFTGKKEKMTLDGIVIFGLILFSFILFTYTYSIDIYPYIPSTIGGGKVTPSMIIDKKGKKILGEIILKTSDRLFLKTKSDEIILFNYNDIYKIGEDTSSFAYNYKKLTYKVDSIINSKKKY